MSQSTTGLPSGLESTRRDVLLAIILASAASLGLCSAFAFGFWVRGLIDRDVGRAARAEKTPVAAAGQPSVAVDPVAGSARLAVAESPRPGREIPPSDRPLEAPRPAVVANVPVQARPVGLPPAEVPAPRFVLSDPAPKAAAPFILPAKPDFALADLKLDETAACSNTEPVCAVDRSLNTAMTWAKSPAEAAEKARQDGKLVFLIHVSGNFESPGFT